MEQKENIEAIAEEAKHQNEDTQKPSYDNDGMPEWISEGKEPESNDKGYDSDGLPGWVNDDDQGKGVTSLFDGIKQAYPTTSTTGTTPQTMEAVMYIPNEKISDILKTSPKRDPWHNTQPGCEVLDMGSWESHSPNKKRLPRVSVNGEQMDIMELRKRLKEASRTGDTDTIKQLLPLETEIIERANEARRQNDPEGFKKQGPMRSILVEKDGNNDNGLHNIAETVAPKDFDYAKKLIDSAPHYEIGENEKKNDPEKAYEKSNPGYARDNEANLPSDTLRKRTDEHESERVKEGDNEEKKPEQQKSFILEWLNNHPEWINQHPQLFFDIVDQIRQDQQNNAPGKATPKQGNTLNSCAEDITHKLEQNQEDNSVQTLVKTSSLNQRS